MNKNRLALIAAIAFFVCVLIGGLLTSAAYFSNEQHTVDLNKTYTYGTDVHEIRVNTVSGDVQIERTNDTNITVKSVGECTYVTLKNINWTAPYMVAEDKDGVLKVYEDDPKWEMWIIPNTCSLDISLTIPESVNLTITTVSGDTMITGSYDSIKYNGVSGDMHSTATVPSADYETVSGDMEISNTAQINARSTSGDITASDFASGRFDTVSGNVHITPPEGSVVSFDTVSGQMRGQITIGSEANIQVTTVSGDLMVE